MSNLRLWGLFVALGAIWGSSYLFIKIAGRDLGPFTLVAVRLAFGTLGLWVLLAVMRLRPALDRSTLLKSALMGLINVSLPFVLITWAEKTIDSGMAAVLNSSVPLFAILIAHFALHDEKITWLRAGGLLAGFAGVAVIFSKSLGQVAGTGPALAGQVAVVMASLSYAAATVFARRALGHLHPTVAAAMQVTSALIFSLIGALAFESPLKLAMSGLALFSLVWLGLLGTCLAYFLYFSLVRGWGATRTTLVTYLIPVVSVALGALILSEKTGWQLLAGFALIAGGIALVNFKRKPAQPPIPAAELSDS
jgi:drug/metabolite transporter (DMT)-like permease